MAATLTHTNCPACSGTKRTAHPTIIGIYSCKGCDAVYGECYLGQSYSIVLPYWNEDAGSENIRYFDFMTLGSKGIERRHGWYDRDTKKIVQTG